MKGKILDYSIQKSSGVISGDDENRYSFISSEWRSDKSPEVNQIVDFEIDGKEAKGIYLETNTIIMKNRNSIGENALFFMVDAGKTIMGGSYILMIIATIYFFLVGYGILSILLGIAAMFNIFIVGFGLKFIGNALLGDRALPNTPEADAKTEAEKLFKKE